jgi:hypothetical protein
VVFGRFIKEVTARRVVEYAAHIVNADIIGPGNGQIHPLDHVFVPFLIKSAVLHEIPPH